MTTEHSSLDVHSVPAGLVEDAQEAAARQERRIRGIGPAIVALAALIVLALMAWGLSALFFRAVTGP